MEAPRPRLRTRLALIILPAILIVILSAWALAHWRLVAVAYKFGNVIPAGDPRGEPDWWTFRARRVTFTSFAGRVNLMFGEYRSLAPLPDDQASWEKYKGWETHIFPRAGVKRDEHAAIYWNSSRDFSFLGLGTSLNTKQGEAVRSIAVPYWLLAGVTGTVTLLIWWPHHRRRERAAEGRCIACGYDLRSSGGAPCPECGAITGLDAEPRAADAV